MEQVEHSDDESKRIEELLSYSILDTPPEINFDQLAHLAASICGTPIALIGFIDADRHWFKSCVGINMHEIPRHLSTCNKAIEQFDLYEVENIMEEPRDESADYLRNQGFAFYAGIPITTGSGQNIGTVCVIDRVPRKLNNDQVRNLKLIASQILDLLKLRQRYTKNLTRLHELYDSKIEKDRKIEEIAHKSSMRGMAELSAGLSYRIRMQMIIIENVRKKLFTMFYHESDDSLIQLNLMKDSIGNIFSILESLEKYITAEKDRWMKPLELNAVVSEVVAHLEHKIKKHQIRIHVHLETDLICVGNFSQLTEAVFAVLNNAIEAVQEMNERVITITLEKKEHYGIIQVKDTGHGVAEKIKPFIFQPFFTTKGPQGLGTGLSLAEAIMYKHSGDIYLVKDRNPTTFQLSLPVP